MTPHAEWTLDAQALLTHWAEPQNIPHVDPPLHHRWISRDGLEAVTFIVWTEQFQQDWAPRVHEIVGEACVEDMSAWKYQRPFYFEVYRSFFGVANPHCLFNAIAVTPSRMPRHLWQNQGRLPLTENPVTETRWRPMDRRFAPIELRWLSHNLSIPIDDVVWMDRSEASRTALRLARTSVQRKWGKYHITMHRVFEADREADSEPLIRGAIPALEQAVVQVSGALRTCAPMIQLWRFDRFGMMDLLLLETCGATGMMIDIRWARHSLEYAMTHDPYFAAALRDTLRRGQRVFRDEGGR